MNQITEDTKNNTQVIADVNLNDIFYQLHDIAKKEALKVKPGYDLINLGISEVKKTFIGACDSVIIVNKDEKSLEEYIANYDVEKASLLDEALKEDCFLILRTYVLFFIGEKQANEVDKEELLANEQTLNVKTESKKINWHKSLLENLFEGEGDGDDIEDRSLEDYDAEAAATDAAAEDAESGKVSSVDTKDNEKDVGNKYIVGYSLKYSCEYEGVKKGTIQLTLNWAKNFYKNHPIIVGITKGLINITGKAIKSLFGALTNNSVARDLSKLSFGTFGGNKLEIGKTVAGAAKGIAKAAAGTAKGIAKLAKLAGKTFGRQDFAKIIDLFKSKLNSKFHGNKLQVDVVQTNALMIDLKQQGKYDAEIDDKIKKIHPEYVISIQASKSDKFYSQYSVKNFAKLYNEAVKPSSNVWTSLSMKESNIIKIQDYNPSNEVKPDNLEDRKNESVEIRTNNLMSLMFENFHEYISLNEANAELTNNFKKLFIKDGKISADAIDEVVLKLKDDDSFEIDKAKLSKIQNKDTLIAKIKEIDNEEKLNAFVGRYSTQDEKLKYILDKFTGYLDKSSNRLDSIVDKFITDDEVDKIKLKHIVKMLKDDTSLTDDLFKVKGKIKDKADFLKLLADCKTKDDIYALFENYNNPASLKVLDDNIKEYVRKNKLERDDKVDLYLMFKKHKFEQNLDKTRDSGDNK